MTNPVFRYIFFELINLGKLENNVKIMRQD